MKYRTVEQVDERILEIFGSTGSQNEHQALIQIREMLARDDSKIDSIEKVLEDFRPIQRALNYWLCGVDVRKWAGVTRDMVSALEAKIEALKPPTDEC